MLMAIFHNPKNTKTEKTSKVVKKYQADFWFSMPIYNTGNSDEKSKIDIKNQSS